MNHDERESIQRELERETRFRERQELMKQLWRLAQNAAKDSPKTIVTQDAKLNPRAISNSDA